MSDDQGRRKSSFDPKIDPENNNDPEVTIDPTVTVQEGDKNVYRGDVGSGETVIQVGSHNTIGENSQGQRSKPKDPKRAARREARAKARDQRRKARNARRGQGNNEKGRVVNEVNGEQTTYPASGPGNVFNSIKGNVAPGAEIHQGGDFHGDLNFTPKKGKRTTRDLLSGIANNFNIDTRNTRGREDRGREPGS